MQRERRVVSGYREQQSGVEMATKRGARATNGRHNTHSLRQRKRKRRVRPKLRVVAEEAQNQVAEDASRPRAWNASSGDHAHEAVALGRPQHRRSRSQAMPRMPHTPGKPIFPLAHHVQQRRVPQEDPRQAREHPLPSPEQSSWDTPQGQGLHHHRRRLSQGDRVSAFLSDRRLLSSQTALVDVRLPSCSRTRVSTVT